MAGGCLHRMFQKFITLAPNFKTGKMIKALNVCLLIVMGTIFLAAGFSSCQKKIDPEADHITGVFHGVDCNHNPAPNVLARQSDDEKTISMTITPSGLKDACFKPIDIVGTLSPTSDTVTFQAQTFYDKCGHKFTGTGLGKISGHAFGYSITYVMEINGIKDSVKNCFAGAK